MNRSILKQNNYNMDSQQSENTLQHLVDLIGFSNACELLRSSLRLIAERQNELESALKHNQDLSARHHAHRIIGSVRLYGSPRLEEMLFMIGNQPFSEVNTVEFQQALSAEFESVISTVREWLELQCAAED